MTTPLTDQDNLRMVEIEDPEAQQGQSVEDAYRELAGLPPEPVIEPEEF